LYHEPTGLIAFEENVFDGEEPSLVVESMKEQKRWKNRYQTMGEVPTAGGTVPTTFVVGRITQDHQRVDNLHVHHNTAEASFLSRQVGGDFALMCPPLEKAASQEENDGDTL
jgi:hypothetical protein